MEPTERMSDEEVICAWMEPEGRNAPFRGDEPQHPYRWWEWYGKGANTPEGFRHFPRNLHLDAIWEVEDRVINDMPLNWWLRYEEALRELRGQLVLWHAAAPTRIKALASVLRAEVEGRTGR